MCTFQYTGSTNEHDGNDQQEVYTRVDNELYGDGCDRDRHDYDNDEEIAQMQDSNTYDEPSGVAKGKYSGTENGYSKLQRGRKE